MSIDSIKCGLLRAKPISKDLGGISYDPFKISVVSFGQTLTLCLQAKQYIESQTGIKLEIDYKEISERTLKIHHSDTFYTIELFDQATLFTQGTLRQLHYFPQRYNFSPFYSVAYFSPKNNIQYSQIILPSIFWEIIHELVHGWYSFFDLPDNTHKYLYEIKDGAQVTVEEAFPKILGEIFPSKKLPLLFHLPALKKKR